jgi:hypothetical protein
VHLDEVIFEQLNVYYTPDCTVAQLWCSALRSYNPNASVAIQAANESCKQIPSCLARLWVLQRQQQGSTLQPHTAACVQKKRTSFQDICSSRYASSVFIQQCLTIMLLLLQ